MSSESAKAVAKEVLESGILEILRRSPFLEGNKVGWFGVSNEIILNGNQEAKEVLLAEIDRIISGLKNSMNGGGGERKESAYLYTDSETRKLRRQINIKTRFFVFNRDGFKCQFCGRTAQEEGVKLHVDHIKPFSRGGLTEISNLQTLCSDCNLGKKDFYEEH